MWGGVEDKGEFNYVIRTFVIVTMYPQYNNNIIKDFFPRKKWDNDFKCFYSHVTVFDLRSGYLDIFKCLQVNIFINEMETLVT
jgi:hypothetical protein